MKPEVGASDDTWGTKINADLDAIDNLLELAGADTVLKLAHGGTGAATAEAARTNLGLGALAVLGTSPALVDPTCTSLAATGDVSSSGGKGNFQTVESAGQVWSKATGFKFPDGSTQATAAGALATRAHTQQGTSTTAAANTRYAITANSVVLTLPASPANGDWVEAIGHGVTGCSIARNSKTIAGLSEDLTLDVDPFAVCLVFDSTLNGWRFAA
ncbi:MAG: hypothetical protein ABFE08_09030 [Armatimonadia bacterium]